MSAPEYLVCLNCESPTYIFEWEAGEAVETFCEMCGSEDEEQFLTEEEFEALGSDDAASEPD